MLRTAAPSRSLFRFAPLVDWAALLFAACLLALRFLELHHAIAPTVVPTSFGEPVPGWKPAPGFGWWSWFDQNLYLQAALAWIRGDLSPAAHWYPPGYPLLGAAFARLTPLDPFMVPDLLCEVAALWLFATITARLLPAWPLGRTLGAILFVASSVYPKTVAAAWVVPWTTTPATVCLLLCLLGTIRFVELARRGDAALAAFGAATALAFRPGDAAVVGAVCIAAILATMLLRWRGLHPAAQIVGAALAGALPPLLLFGAAYLMTSGLREDGYLAGSRAYGFEWGLLPLRWVLLMISPRPLFLEGEGLAQAFPWIMPGLAGLLAALLTRRGRWLVHAVVAGSIVLDTVQFLCYRDLHPDYLWANGVYHYFKWTLPFYALYGVLILRALAAGPRLVAAGAVAVVAFGLCAWRVEVTDAQALPLPEAQAVALPHGLSSLRDVLFLRTLPGEAAYLPVGAAIETDGERYKSLESFKLTPWPETLMVQPLRAMPDAAATLHLPPAYRLDTAVAPVLARQSLAWGLPCWFRPERMACQTSFVLPPPPLAVGQTIRFGADGDGGEYLAGGMSLLDPAFTWTVAPQAALTFDLPVMNASPVLELTAAGFVPRGYPAIRAAVFVNGVPAGDFAFGADPQTVRIKLPPGGEVWVAFAIANPRAPASLDRTSADMRPLGVQLRSMRVVAG